MKKLLTILFLMGLTGAFAQDESTSSTQDTQTTTLSENNAEGKRGFSPRGEGKGQRQMPQEMIAKFDKDGDGTLSDDEKTAMREEMKAQMTKKFDADGDGVLSDEEKTAMRENMKNRRGGEGPRRGERGPRGGEDNERQKEQMENNKDQMAKIAALLEKFDADGDGKLSQEELMAAREAMKAKRPQGQNAPAQE